MGLLLKIIIVSFFVLTVGCTKYGPFSETGTTEFESRDGHKAKETVNLEDCTMTIELEENEGFKSKRTFPLDPEMCEREKTKESKKSD